jgi:tyrosine recombinase XerD
MDKQIAAFIAYLQAERNASDHTIVAYRTDLRQFGVFLKGEGVEWADIDRITLRRYLMQLQAGGYARTSVGRKIAALRSFYRFLVREKVLPRNPLSVTAPKTGRYLPSFLSLDEVKHLLAAPDLSTAQGRRDHAILEVLYASGMRVSELSGLNLSNIDRGRREIRVWGKGAKERIVIVGEAALEAVQTYTNMARGQLTKGKAINALFVNRSGGRLSERSVWNIIDKYRKQAGIDKEISPHTLRHTFATHMLDGGADLRSVQELLGHANLTTTQIYTHVTQSQARQVYLRAHPRARLRDQVISGEAGVAGEDEAE